MAVHSIYYGDGLDMKVLVSASAARDDWLQILDDEMERLLNVQLDWQYEPGNYKGAHPCELLPRDADSRLQAMIRKQALYYWIVRDLFCNTQTGDYAREILDLRQISIDTNEVTQNIRDQLGPIHRRLKTMLHELPMVGRHYAKYLSPKQLSNIATLVPKLLSDLYLVDNWECGMGHRAEWLPRFSNIMSDDWGFQLPNFCQAFDEVDWPVRVPMDECRFKVVNISNTEEERQLLALHRPQILQTTMDTEQVGEQANVEIATPAQEMSNTAPENGTAEPQANDQQASRPRRRLPPTIQNTRPEELMMRAPSNAQRSWGSNHQNEMRRTSRVNGYGDRGFGSHHSHIVDAITRRHDPREGRAG